MRILFSAILILLNSSFALAIANPDIGVNALILYHNSNFHQADMNPAALDTNPNGLNLQEAEISFKADVDPYNKLSLLLSVSPEYSTDGTTVTQGWLIEPEEVFAENSSIDSVSLKLGKFKAAFGKHNTLHPHADNFVEAPLINTRFLGNEGLNDVGISAASLLPVNWYSEMTLQALRGKGENEQFNSPSSSENDALAHWKNLFDLSEELTFEVGASYATGQNSFKHKTDLIGADFTFKWRPTKGGKYSSFLWATEYISRNQSQAGMDAEAGSGFASWIQYQFTDHWAAAYRYDQMDVENSCNAADFPNGNDQRHSIALNYLPTEFSFYRIEFNQRKHPVVNINNKDQESVFYLQANFTIGSHPAHTY